MSLQQSPTASVNPITLSKKKSPLANPMDVIIISRNSQFVYPITKMAIADKSSHKHVIRRLLGFNNFEVLKSHAASLKLQSMESFDIFKIATIIWRYFKVWCSKQIWFFCNYSTIYVHKFFGVLKYWKKRERVRLYACLRTLNTIQITDQSSSSNTKVIFSSLAKHEMARCELFLAVSEAFSSIDKPQSAKNIHL